jgi:hypothetical protein
LLSAIPISYGLGLISEEDFAYRPSHTRGISIKQNDAEMFRTLPVNPMIRERPALVKKKTPENRAFARFFGIIAAQSPVKRAGDG